MGIFSIISHYYSHGSDVFTLKRRKPNPLLQLLNENNNESNNNGNGNNNHGEYDTVDVIEETISPTQILE